MSWKVIHDIIVPRCTGKTIRVNRGQIFRVIEYEGKQVLDLNFLNAHNYKEHFAAEFQELAFKDQVRDKIFSKNAIQLLELSWADA